MNVTRDLDNIVAKALKKSPAARYPTAAAFADDLRRHLADEPVSARADSWAYRSGLFVRRHRGAVAALSVTLAALVAGVVGTTWQAVEARRERDEAVFQARRAQAKSNLMDLALNVTEGPDHPLTLREILERSVRLTERQFSDDPLIAVDLLVTLAGQYEHAGDAEMDAALMRRAEGIARASGEPLLVADVACNRVSTELGLGRLDSAREQLRRGLAAIAKVDMLHVMLTQAVILLQDTSLVYVVALKDFLGAASKAGQLTGRIVELYLFVALVFFLVCFAASWAVKRLQARLAVSR